MIPTRHFAQPSGRRGTELDRARLRRAKRLLYGAAVVVIAWAVAVFVTSCARRVPVTSAPPPPAHRWCFNATTKAGSASGCFSSPRLCGYALAVAQRYGSLVGVKHLGRCELSIND